MGNGEVPSYNSCENQPENNETQKALKDTLGQVLECGMNIKDKQMFEGLKKLMQVFDFPDLCSFEEIVNAEKITERTREYKFSLKLKGEKIYLYPATGVGFSSSFGYIENGKFQQDISLFNFDVISGNAKELPLELETCSQVIQEPNYQQLLDERESLHDTVQRLQEEKLQLQQELNQIHSNKNICENNQSDNDDLIRNINQREINENIQENGTQKEYIVQKGDTLWKIVKEYYGLTSHRDIANCINKLVKYNVEEKNTGRLQDDVTGDNILGDKIYIGQKLLLAQQLTFRTQKFHLKI